MHMPSMLKYLKLCFSKYLKFKFPKYLNSLPALISLMNESGALAKHPHQFPHFHPRHVASQKTLFVMKMYFWKNRLLETKRGHTMRNDILGPIPGSLHNSFIFLGISPPSRVWGRRELFGTVFLFKNCATWWFWSLLRWVRTLSDYFPKTYAFENTIPKKSKRLHSERAWYSSRQIVAHFLRYLALLLWNPTPLIRVAQSSS